MTIAFGKDRPTGANGKSPTDAVNELGKEETTNLGNEVEVSAIAKDVAVPSL